MLVKGNVSTSDRIKEETVGRVEDGMKLHTPLVKQGRNVRLPEFSGVRQNALRDMQRVQQRAQIENYGNENKAQAQARAFTTDRGCGHGTTAVDRHGVRYCTVYGGSQCPKLAVASAAGVAGAAGGGDAGWMGVV
ncbi:hypothetical protein CBL_13781 [Carabus blaptoides fortunei]